MKYKYAIVIKKPSKERSRNRSEIDKIPEKYLLNYSKNYGDGTSGAVGYQTEEQIIDAIKRTIRDWEGFDSELNRVSDKVTMNNLYFESFTNEITIADILGEPQCKTQP